MNRLAYYFVFVLIPSAMLAQTPADDPHWTLLWEDHFTFFDDTKWTKAHMCDHSDNGNPNYQEPQLFLADNVYITDDDFLTLEINDNAVHCPGGVTPTSWICGGCVEGTRQYTSGWVETKSDFSLHYGYVEARIRFPAFDGCWPAFWTWNAEAEREEIDMVEIVHGRKEDCEELVTVYNEKLIHDENVITTNIHLGKYDDAVPVFPGCGVTGNFQVHKRNDYTVYHVYGMEWTPEKIIFYIDGKVYRSALNPGLENLTTIIFGLGMDPSFENDQNIIFPERMYIDWIKVWTKEKDCNEVINTSNYDLSNHDNKVKNFIKIGSNNGTNKVSIGESVHLRAAKFISISGNCSIPIGAKFFADANNECDNLISPECTQIFNSCNCDFATYENEVMKEIDIGNCSNQIQIENGSSNIELKAVEYIRIKPGVNLKHSDNKSISLTLKSCP
jgi:beta-glucanase (GH16 family)